MKIAPRSDREPKRRPRTVGGDVLAEAEAIGFDVLLAWITEGPDRPPRSNEELLEWARERGLC